MTHLPENRMNRQVAKNAKVRREEGGLRIEVES
jgi:hypothetical protein